MDDAAVTAPVNAAGFGLPAEALAALCGVLSLYPKVVRAVVFGSRAKGNYRSGSDIDLTLDGAALTPTDLSRIDTALDDLMLPWKVDLSLLSQINNPGLLEHIACVGQPLWTKKE